MLVKNSFIELNAREKAAAILDPDTFRELLGPFDRIESPHLAPQGIVPQSDDGVVIARGLINGASAVVIAIEGAFQGGGIGEVSGAKIAGALEQALKDNEEGIRTKPVLLLETGGVRLQEGNYGLLAIAEMQAAIVALRRYVPVVGVVSGMIGCFGGMSITSALCTALIMTRQGRLQLNGPEVIEQEAGIREFDSSDRPFIWSTAGGEQRFATGMVDTLVRDDVAEIYQAVRDACQRDVPLEARSSQVERFLSRLAVIDPSAPLDASRLRALWGRDQEQEVSPADERIRELEEVWRQTESKDRSRGRTWFEALTGATKPEKAGAPSVLCADASLDGECVRYIAVVPNAKNRFPRARHGEVGLDEGWTIARYVRDAIKADEHGKRRAIVAIVDVPSQAYGYREELLGIHLACAAAADAYASARLAGHPVIALLVGNAISGAFLAHGLQASRILALDDPGVAVQVMSRTSAARVTRRSIEELEEAAKKLPATAYDIRSFASLGSLHELLADVSADEPAQPDIENVQSKLKNAISETRNTTRDLSHRLTSDHSRKGRAASIKVRVRMAEQWNC
ncbi:biotin-independent malonate decarboxylase subunit beta [Paenibacillus sp. MZ04-78.2]|uniref:biotin-independent malonate decarboxylase subunit beta n=1 Tax=Paenibacillus sp. MZ04-78.2 TaxID=2962034 RepID=UPI0020B7A7B1|nr:biotin-independent malonate decarboxylase subunit beta [Paenibacillus sp. MZ04-78.2]MCP3773779.1 biotin-independent malonate decarboxylase subunit beta [Paenibacillus sp. MZ04-78.2]